MPPRATGSVPDAISDADTLRFAAEAMGVKRRTGAAGEMPLRSMRYRGMSQDVAPVRGEPGRVAGAEGEPGTPLTQTSEHDSTPVAASLA